MTPIHDLRGRRRAGAQQAWWERRWQRTVDLAFREVPYYREQWASAGRVLSEPVPVRADALSDDLFRLCPLRSPWDPRREPSLWIGGTAALSDALALAGIRPGRGPLLEVRSAIVDRTRVGRIGPAYGVLLAPDADVLDVDRRLEVQRASVALAVKRGRAVVVGPPAQLPAVLRTVEPALDGAAVQWRLVPRLTLRQACTLDPQGGFVVHDPFLGYLGACPVDCGRVHLLWRRVHARATPNGLLFTRIRGRRPTLVNVLSVDSGFAGVERCAIHGTPVLAG